MLKSNVAPVIIVRRKQPSPSVAFDTYWQFAAERQTIFHRRAAAEHMPWTTDPVLRDFKFTNAYRAADRVSQYLIKHVIYARRGDWPSTFVRILLFKLFNKISTWQQLELELGPISGVSFDAYRISSVLRKVLDRGESIYSAAYIMPSGSSDFRRPRKHEMHVELLKSLTKSRLPGDLEKSNSMERAYRLLLDVPTFGPFLAYQFLIDLNYSEGLSFSEMDFVVPGPGAKDGIRKCFIDTGDYDEADTIRWVTERQAEEFSKRELKFKSLWGRPLQLIDCQNLFCEVDKYLRATRPEIKGRSGRKRIKQKFSPHGPILRPWFPPKWGVNDRIDIELQTAPGPSRENFKL